MRSEWVPVSAAALVTGVIALALGQMLNPGGSAATPTEQMVVAAENPGRWLAMSVMFFAGAGALVLGVPSILVHFDRPRGRFLGLTGIAVFVIGCVGVGGLAALLLMFRALAIEALAGGAEGGSDIALVSASLEDGALTFMLALWVYGFVLGVLLIALGLLRNRRTPMWVPGLLLGFLAAQVVLLALEQGGATARTVAAAGLVLLAAGFTGIATHAAAVVDEGPAMFSGAR